MTTIIMSNFSTISFKISNFELFTFPIFFSSFQTKSFLCLLKKESEENLSKISFQFLNFYRINLESVLKWVFNFYVFIDVSQWNKVYVLISRRGSWDLEKPNPFCIEKRKHAIRNYIHKSSHLTSYVYNPLL